MTKIQLHNLLSYFIATVWFINGLYCKILHQVPRHERIVATILNDTYAIELTGIIGFLEVGMAIWVLTRYRSKLNTTLQIVVIFVMNLLEFFIVPNLLLWGVYNSVFALLFMTIIYYSYYLRTNAIY